MLVIEPYYSILHESHTLISGATGSGKTTLLDGFLQYCCNLNKSFAIIDLKRVSLIRFKSEALQYATEPDTALKLLKEIVTTVKHRYTKMVYSDLTETTEPPIYIVIDECADLHDSVMACYEELKLIARMGNAAHIHLVLSTCSPSRKIIPEELAMYISCRVGLRCESMIESRQVVGLSGCEQLPKYGQAILRTPDSIGLVEIKNIK